MIVVVDGSVIVSAALKANSFPEQALLRSIGKRNRLFLSDAVANEYREVLSRPKFDRAVSFQRRPRTLNLILVAAERIEPVEQVQERSDPNDDKYLSLAAAAGAHVIISGDERHLLPTSPWRGITILRPAEFIARTPA